MEINKTLKNDLEIALRLSELCDKIRERFYSQILINEISKKEK